MADIARVGHYEHEFVVNEKRYVLCPLTAEQDREVFEYAESALEAGSKGSGEGTAENIAYMDRFRIAAIAQSLVVIGDLDLRDTVEVETGKKLENGTPEKVSRYQAVRHFVEQWTKPMIEQFFLHFGEMSTRIEEQASREVRYTPSDLSAEIEHIGERLTWASEQLKKHENPNPDLASKIHDHVNEISSLQSRQRSALAGVIPSADPEAVSTPPEASEPTPPPARPAQETTLPQRPMAPQAFTAADRPVPTPRVEDELVPLQPIQQPVQQPVQQPASAPAPQASSEPPDPRFRTTTTPPIARDDRPPARPPAPEVQPKKPAPEELEQNFHEQNPDIEPGSDLSRYTPTGDSMMGDDEAASVETEGRRQAVLRQRRIEAEMEQTRKAEEAFAEGRTPQAQPGVGAQGQVSMTPGGVMVAPGQVVPGQHQPAPVPRAPHREAASTQAAVDASVAARGGAPVGEVQGLPAYPLPRQELSPRTKRTAADNRATKVVVDNVGGGDESVNPRFVGRQRRR